MRRAMLEQADIVAEGGEPKGLVRDPAQNACIRLPIINHDYWEQGFSLAQLQRENPQLAALFQPKEFVFQAGQPEEIRQAYRRAMGLSVEG
jgi:5,5'-dehydrodivanillate O-demethylase oxygenase subunit